MDYRRAYQKGGCYFFTVVTHARRPLLTGPETIRRLREVMGTLRFAPRTIYHLMGTLRFAHPTSEVPYWRWGLEGETTPWYPSLRLFRQRRRGDWAGGWSR